MAIPASILARRILWTEEPRVLQSMDTESDTTEHKNTQYTPTSSFYSRQFFTTLIYLCFVCFYIMYNLLLLFSHSVMSDSAIPQTVVHQAPLSLEFPRQAYWSRLPFPSGDLPDPGITLKSPPL